ncbi:MAG: toxin-antitoxin system TumE family protein [Candidatus Anammoxibacter sp.]
MLHPYHAKKRKGRQVGLIRGRICFVGGTELDFMEYLEIDEEIRKKTYSYHYRSVNNDLIFRYDNAPHHNNVPTFPKHKHLKDGSIISSDEISLNTVIQEAVGIIMAK